MSDTNNKQKANQYPSPRKHQATQQRGKNLREEFGAEFDFHPDQFKEEGKRSTNNQPVSERTAWH